jgi:YD repeat-containing protein
MRVVTLLLFLFCSVFVYGQEANVVVSSPQVSGTTIEATNSITLEPGFSTSANFIARIVEENWFDEVIGSPYAGNENLNWISSSSYDLAGNLTSAGVSYFNSLGKGTQSHSLDIKTGKIWVNEVKYDEFGRAVFSALSAPVGTTYGYRNNFIKKANGATFTQADALSIADDTAAGIIGRQENSLGWYYSDNNTSEPYQDITAFPFSKTVFSTLSPGLGLRTLGGNKVRRTPTSGTEEWLQSYAFSMPLSQELFYAFGTGAFPERAAVENVSGSAIQPYYIQGQKTVVRDAHGVESVVFKDSNGNVLAAARSGNEDNSARKKYRIVTPIGPQGYVDIHIPVGCGGPVEFKGMEALFKLYDLVTERLITTHGSGSITLQPGMYRIEENNTTHHKNRNPYVTINRGAIRLLDENKNIGVAYDVNYYDYSLNYYDKANRLTSSVQPLGFDDALTLTGVRNHSLVSTFSYNSLGQLLATTSPDEGQAVFKYRRDGQIRFSQNTNQAGVGEFSYTDYDPLGRPVESGVCTGNFSNLNPEVLAFSGNRKEQHFTTYDLADTALAAILTANNFSTTHYKQTFIAGNVSKTATQNPNTTTTWYGYDVYGRVEWMLQDIPGLACCLCRRSF